MCFKQARKSGDQKDEEAAAMKAKAKEKGALVSANIKALQAEYSTQLAEYRKKQKISKQEEAKRVELQAALQVAKQKQRSRQARLQSALATAKVRKNDVAKESYNVLNLGS